MSKTISIPKMTAQSPSLVEPSGTQQGDKWVSNNGFFPDVSLNRVRNVMRADGTVTEERLCEAVIEAIAFVNAELAPLRHKAEAAGIFTFEQIESDYINNEPILQARYYRAVGCWAMATLYERYRSVDTTKEGAEKAEEFENSVDGLRRDARFAIRDLLGVQRWTVALV